MSANTSTVQVPDATAMRAAIDSYIVLGFQVATQDATSATMRKPKQFNALWAVIGFVLCLLPLLIYLIVYASEKDQVVRVVIVGRSAFQLSADGAWWWAADRQTWVAFANALPPGAQISPDRRHWWDGSAWNPMPSSDPPSAAQSPTPQAYFPPPRL